MGKRSFYAALKDAKTPVDFVYAVGDQPLSDERPEVDEQEWLDEREAMIAKAREFQTMLNVLPYVISVLRSARARLAVPPVAAQTSPVIDSIDRLVERLDGQEPWTMTP